MEKQKRTIKGTKWHSPPTIISELMNSRCYGDVRVQFGQPKTSTQILRTLLDFYEWQFQCGRHSSQHTHTHILRAHTMDLMRSAMNKWGGKNRRLLKAEKSIQKTLNSLSLSLYAVNVIILCVYAKVNILRSTHESYTRKVCENTKSGCVLLPFVQINTEEGKQKEVLFTRKWIIFRK